MKRKLRGAVAGFTLVELMVTLAIAAVLMMVAVQSFQSYARNAAVTRVSGNFFNETQLARANAMRMSRHTLVQVVDADLGWVGGWRVYADVDRDMKYTTGTDTLIVEEGPVGDGVMSNGDSDNNLDNRGTLESGFLLFNPAGFPRSASDGIATGSVVFYLPEGRATAVVFSNAGRIRRCDPNKTGCRSAT